MVGLHPHFQIGGITNLKSSFKAYDYIKEVKDNLLFRLPFKSNT